MPLVVDQTIGEEIQHGGGGGGGGGAFPDVENYVIVSNTAVPESGKVYTNISSAISYINSLPLSSTNRAVIHVYSKEDTSNFTIPLFCTVLGATAGAILSGTITASGIIAPDADVYNPAKYPTLDNFIITGTITFAGLSTLLEGNLIIKNCDITLGSGGIVTGPTYQGVCNIFKSFVRRLEYKKALSFRIVDSIVGGVFTFNSSTTQQVNFESCTFERQPTYPPTDTEMHIDADVDEQMQVRLYGCLITSKPKLFSIGNGWFFTNACLSHHEAYCDISNFNGQYVNEGNVYVKGMGVTSTQGTVDKALDELFLTKSQKFLGWQNNHNYLVDDYILDDDVLYRCIANHNSGASKATNLAQETNWRVIKSEKFRTVTANTTINATDTYIMVDATSNNITITVPPGNSFPAYSKIIIVRVDNSSNYVEIKPSAGSLNGQSSAPADRQYLAFQYQKLHLTPDKTNPDWFVAGEGITGFYSPTFGDFTNITSVSILGARYNSVPGVNQANNLVSALGNPTTVQAIILVETTASGTYSEFTMTLPKNWEGLTNDIIGSGSIKATSDVGTVHIEEVSLTKIKVAFKSLTASPDSCKINLSFTYSVV